MTITIIDYGVGNLGSIQNMLKKLGADSVIARDVSAIDSATKLILPGVGSFDFGMQQLEMSGLRVSLDFAVLQRKVPVLGICLGMQLMTQGSEEGVLPGLGWIKARTIRFKFPSDIKLKIPHMGWNVVNVSKPNIIFNPNEMEERFYFVHSYHVECDNSEDVLTTTSYGLEFTSSFQHENIIGVQFHPEKSHRFGCHILKKFSELVI